MGNKRQERSIPVNRSECATLQFLLKGGREMADDMLERSIDEESEKEATIFLDNIITLQSKLEKRVVGELRKG